MFKDFQDLFFRCFAYLLFYVITTCWENWEKLSKSQEISEWQWKIFDVRYFFTWQIRWQRVHWFIHNHMNFLSAIWCQCKRGPAFTTEKQQKFTFTLTVVVEGAAWVTPDTSTFLLLLMCLWSQKELKMIKIIASVLGLISKVKAHESCCSHGHSHDHDEHIEQQEEEPWLSTLDIVVLGAAGKN